MTAIPPENNGNNKFRNSFAECWMPIQKITKFHSQSKAIKILIIHLEMKETLKPLEESHDREDETTIC